MVRSIVVTQQEWWVTNQGLVILDWGVSKLSSGLTILRECDMLDMAMGQFTFNPLGSPIIYQSVFLLFGWLLYPIGWLVNKY